MRTVPDEIAERVKTLVEKRVVRYARPAIRSVKVPLAQLAPSGGCNPAGCNPQGCAPPGPCGPWRR